MIKYAIIAVVLVMVAYGSLYCFIRSNRYIPIPVDQVYSGSGPILGFNLDTGEYWSYLFFPCFFLDNWINGIDIAIIQNGDIKYSWGDGYYSR